MLDKVCRLYQSFFPNTHLEQTELVQLHTKGNQNGDLNEFMQRYFDHEFEKGLFSLDRFQTILPDALKGRVLDFGCGGGGLTYRMAQRCDEAVGIDLDPQNLAFARAQSDRLDIQNVEFICYPGGDVPLPSASFDTIVCVDVMEHLPGPERFVKEFERLLKPGGKLLLSFGPPWRHAHGKHIWDRLPGWWVHLIFPSRVCMKAAGFSPETTWEELGLHRLTIRKFEQVVKKSVLLKRHCQYQCQKRIRSLRAIPWLRELIISEVVAIFEKPQGTLVVDGPIEIV